MRGSKIQVRVKIWSRQERMRAGRAGCKSASVVSEVISEPLIPWVTVELTKV